MIVNVIIWLILVFCSIKTIGYGVYTLKRKNIVGAVSIFVLAALVLAGIAVFV